MYSLRRWWEVYGTRLVVGGGVVSIAWILSQTQAAVITELYYYLTHPFQVRSADENWMMEARFLELQERLIELESQNTQLRTLVNAQQPNGIKGTFAPIIGRSADQWWQQVLLGRGNREGVQVGASVLAPGGLVGRVITVTANTSRVLLISDPESSVGVMISRSRSQGYVRGQGSDQLVMRFFDKEPDVRPGDVVTTSSISTLFPAGLPVGVIESVQMRASPTPEAIVRLTAPISRLEWVTIAPHTAPVSQTSTDREAQLP
jgi:rod shape-determining protein MreC